MAINIFQIQKGIVTKLEADAGVKTALGDPARIHSATPPGVVFPFCRVQHVGSLPLEMVIGGTAGKSQLTVEIFRFTVFTLKMGGEQASDAVVAIEAVMKTGGFQIAESSRAIEANFATRGLRYDTAEPEASGYMAWTQWDVQMQDT